MAHLVEVAFKGNRREFFLWDGDAPPALTTPVIVEADRGEDLGRVHAVGEIAALRARGCTHGTGGAEPTLKVLRPASRDDVRRLADLRAQDETVRREAVKLVQTHALAMKLTDTEWRWDRRKLAVYFTADRRVDFRALVRDLAARFRARIELKQIGVRDEAKRLDGVGRCGRQYCSASWLPELRPVNLGLAKDQKLSLNPTQISGACGRLMCCLRYEHDWYVKTRKLFPKEGKVVTTALGEERVVANDLFRERVTLRKVADGEARVIALAQLNRELSGEPIETDAETEPLPIEEWSDELLAMTDTVERPIPRALRPPSPAERPVTIERAPSARDTRRPADTARRSKDAPRRPPRPRDASVRPSNAPLTVPSPAPASTHDEPDEQPPEETQSDSAARPRRRRGRRRGRRGGSGGSGGSGGNSGTGGTGGTGGGAPPGAPT